MRVFDVTKNTTPLQVYKAVMQCSAETLEDAGVIIQNENKSDNYSLCKFTNIIHALMRKGLLAKDKYPEDVCLMNTSGNHPVSWHSGCRLTDLQYSHVLYADSEFLVCSEMQSSGIFDYPVEVMFLTDVLKIDTMYKLLGNAAFDEVHIATDIFWQTIIMKDKGIIYVENDCRIQAECPIVALGALTITGDPGRVLALDNTSIAQPCIGGYTNMGLGYGKWSVSRTICNHITVDKVVVNCTSVEPAFMLGEYGTDNVPSIMCTNDGKLNAVESGKIRRMIRSQTKYPASVKYDDFPLYAVFDMEE